MNKVKKAFDSIQAEDNLKANTLVFLQTKMQKNLKLRNRMTVKKLALVLSAFVIVLFSCAFSYNLYFTPSAYLDIDINPSIELSINHFDRVIGTYAYNSDGEDILSGLNLKHKSYNEAVQILIDIITEHGYLYDGGLVSATLHTEDSDREYNLLANIKADISNAVSKHHILAQIDVFSVDSEIRHCAHDQNISPAKYLAILALQEVMPAATVEGCRNHTIGEIKQITHDASSDTNHGNNRDNKGCHNGRHD